MLMGGLKVQYLLWVLFKGTKCDDKVGAKRVKFEARVCWSSEAEVSTVWISISNTSCLEIQ